VGPQFDRRTRKTVGPVGPITKPRVETDSLPSLLTLAYCYTGKLHFKRGGLNTPVPESATPISAGRKGLLDRALSVFTEVRPGESGSAILLAGNVFLLLSAYYILKVVRDSLILAESGAEVASYSAAGQAVLLLAVVPAYGAFASRVNRIRLISWATLFFISHLAIFFLLGNAGYRVGIAFYLWLGIFNVFVVAQFWAFANDIYTEGQGKRLFPMIGVGASLGAWVGSTVVTQIFRKAGPYLAMVMAAVILLLCVLITLWVNQRESSRGNDGEAKKVEEPLGKEGGFQLVIKSPYLRSIAFLILLLNLVNTTGGYMLNSLVESTADAQIAAGVIPKEERRAFMGEFIGGVYSWVNLLGLLIQMFLVSRLFQFLGVRGALFILPCIALGGYGLLVALPLLQVVRIVKIAENSTDYSLMNTIRAALYLPTSREAKYKAKQAIDTFFVRLGDMLQAGIVFSGVQLGFGIRQFSMVNVCFVLLWLVAAGVIYREHKKLTAGKQQLQAAA
jgi:AAA family ATP:ADP antiporter